MILVHRGTEPEALRKERLAKMPELRRIAKTRQPRSKEIVGYKVASGPLWRGQQYKCCYCEAQVPEGYNDVEHYRPKGRAIRLPGSTDERGYWWLAFTWQNLLFSCPGCNRSRKKDHFPLAAGSVALVASQRSPGREQPLLIDPAEKSAVPHIQFVFTRVLRGTTPPDDAPPGWELRKHWWPRARNGSAEGDRTIRVCGLDTGEHCELYDRHVNNHVRRIAERLNAAMKRPDAAAVTAAHADALRLLQPTMPYVALSYDALQVLVDPADFARWKMEWPTPHEVGRVEDPSLRGRHRR